MDLLQNPTSKLLFVVAELYQERQIDDAQKRSLKGRLDIWNDINGLERIFINDKNLLIAATNITDVELLK